MILGADGAKLSKRHGAVSVLQYQEEGYLPDALLNYLVRLGWSHGDQEVFTREEMIAAFDIRDVNKAASAFNREKLLWLNQQHMMKAPLAVLAAALARAAGATGRREHDQALLEGVVNAQRERSKTLKEMAENSRYFFAEIGAIDAKAAAKHLGAEALQILADTAQGSRRAGRLDARAHTRRAGPGRRTLRHRARQSRAAAAGGGHRGRRLAADRHDRGAAGARTGAGPGGAGARGLTEASGLRSFAPLSWGHSSAGRALAWHARGRRFDPAWLHHDFRFRRPHRLEAQDTALSRRRQGFESPWGRQSGVRRRQRAY